MTADWDPNAFIKDYGDPLAEAKTCRSNAALFDFSFMSRADIAGPGAERAIARLTSRSLEGFSPRRIRYAFRQDEQGILRSDLTIWKHAPNRFEVMSGRYADIADLAEFAAADTHVTDLSASTVIYAVQGPRALEVLSALGDTKAVAELSYFEFCEWRYCGETFLVGRLGYTGEAGFEIVAPAGSGADLWERLGTLARPSGFAAMDILRIEAGFVLFANEFRVPVTVREIGLERFARDGGNGNPAEISLVCFQADTDADITPWYPVHTPSRPSTADVLVPTSACLSPVAGGVLGLGFVQTCVLQSPRPVFDQSGTFRNIAIDRLPYYDSGKNRPRRPWT